MSVADGSLETHRAFAAMLESRRAAGVRRLHIMAHSMGCRLFCAALPLLEPHLSGSAGPSLELATTAFINPEMCLRSFVEKSYAPLRRLCRHVTIYADRGDAALNAAECLFTHEPELGKHPFALVRELPPRWGARRAPAARLSEALRGYASEDTLTLCFDADAEPLDLDVIDISWMDTNVHGPRHNFFNVNRWLIDDLLEVIVTQKRARARTHRLSRLKRAYGQKSGNVWAFLAAPAHIVNL